MPQYRARDVLVEAVQYFPGIAVEGLTVTHGELIDYGLGVGNGMASVRTRCGRERVRAGDWVVTYASGLRLVLSNDEFVALYGEVNAFDAVAAELDAQSDAREALQ